MKKSKIVEALGAHVAKHRTQELKHVLFNSKSDKLGKVYNMISRTYLLHRWKD